MCIRDRHLAVRRGGLQRRRRAGGHGRGRCCDACDVQGPREGVVKRLVLLAAAVLACGDDSSGDDDGPDHRTFDQCDGDPASFVRQAFLALDGHRPRSQGEVDAYVAIYEQAADRGDDPVDVTARAIMSRPEFTERWVDVVMDALRVQRMDIQTEASCW